MDPRDTSLDDRVAAARAAATAAGAALSELLDYVRSAAPDMVDAWGFTDARLGTLAGAWRAASALHGEARAHIRPTDRLFPEPPALAEVPTP